MARKTVLLLFMITFLCQVSAIALIRNATMELIIEPKVEQSNTEQQLTISVYNGYQLVESKTTTNRKSVTILLDLYCNYLVSIEQNGVVVKKYRVSTEVPQKENRDWKLLLPVQILKSVSTEQLAVVGTPAANISYSSNDREFTCKEPMYPMADQTMVDSLGSTGQNIHHINQQ